jgi:hypothetical protein
MAGDRVGTGDSHGSGDRKSTLPELRWPRNPAGELGPDVCAAADSDELAATDQPPDRLPAQAGTS